MTSGLPEDLNAPHDYEAAEDDVITSGARRPRRSFVICSTSGSGSTLLGEGMWSAGGMGLPAEYLNQEVAARLGRRWGTSSLGQYLSTLVRRRTDETGAFALKTHWSKLHDFRSALAAEKAQSSTDGRRVLVSGSETAFLGGAFPNPVFIHMTRHNRTRQAVSWYVAARTGIWAKKAGVPVESVAVPEFDARTTEVSLVD